MLFITLRRQRAFRKNTRAVSPAISTVMITSAVVVMILVAMSYTNDYLNRRLAENEFATNKQFMLTTGLQIDDIAWTMGRTQTVRYSSRFGQMSFQNGTLSYSVAVSYMDGHSENLFTYETGIILFNMPVREYTLGNAYFERVFPTNDSFVQDHASAPVSHVYVTEKLPMSDGNFTRVVAAPSIRQLDSSIGSKFYLPSLVNGTNLHLSQSVTLAGQTLIQYTRSNVRDVQFTLTFPQEGRGFDSSFFQFAQDTVTLDVSKGSPSGSLVEFYLGEVTISLGVFA